MDKTCVCSECHKQYSNHSNLIAHVKKLHKDKFEIMFPKKVYKYQCNSCSRKFNHLHNLKHHQVKNNHLPVSINQQVKPTHKCALCENVGTKVELLQHLQSVHGLKIETESRKFASEEEFNLWKTNIEKESKSSFVKESSAYKGKYFYRTAYVCHRSGVYKSRGKGERHLKTQGSNKINGYCPAVLNVTVKSTACEVQYTKTHVGHENDLGHLCLSKSEREMLATKIATKIPMDAILDEIRDSVVSSNLERLHLLTRKDLYNIEHSYNLNATSVRHKNDAISVQAWVHEMKASGCVLFYKPQGEILDSQPNLQKQDFYLVIMNQGQFEMLKKYGHDCICVDGTHGLNAYGFEMHTLLVLNQLREGFPCCFFISSKSDEDALKIFFSSIKEKLGYPITPKVFMSDLAESYYNAWMQVMGLASFRLYCTWHVDRAWRKNLPKINSKEKQLAVYKQLRTLLQETDTNAFDLMSKNFLSSLANDEETLEFCEYFTRNYVKNVASWAYCHRIHSGLNTNMHIERMHRTIKYLYLNGKYTKRLDKAIFAILKFVRDKLFDQIIVINKGKLCSKIKDLRSRHKKSESLSLNSVLPSDGGWQVLSSSSEEFYYIQEENKNCSCKLVCSDCKICIHNYSCSCLDSSIRWNMCKHIHLLCRYISTTSESVEVPAQNSDENELCVDMVSGEIQNETAVIAAQLVNKNYVAVDNTNVVAVRKEKIKNDLLEALRILENTTSLPELDVLENILRPLKPTLAALQHSNVENMQLDPKIRETNIVPQRQFFSTRKTKVIREKSIKKPSNCEKNNISVRLLNDNKND